MKTNLELIMDKIVTATTVGLRSGHETFTMTRMMDVTWSSDCERIISMVSNALCSLQINSFEFESRFRKKIVTSSN